MESFQLRLKRWLTLHSIHVEYSRFWGPGNPLHIELTRCWRRRQHGLVPARPTHPASSHWSSSLRFFILSLPHKSSPCHIKTSDSSKHVAATGQSRPSQRKGRGGGRKGCGWSSGLTRFLGGGVDGRGLRAGPSRVEGGHWQVVGAAGPQPADVDLREVARDANLAHGVGLGVVLPVHHLWAPQRPRDLVHLHFLVFFSEARWFYDFGMESFGLKKLKLRLKRKQHWGNRPINFKL